MDGETLGTPARSAHWRAVAKVLRSPTQLFHDLVNTLVPAPCRLCEGPLEQAGMVAVCTVCLDRITPDATLGCGICGDASDFAASIGMEDQLFARSMRTQLLCRECRLVPPAYTRAVSFGTYTGELRGLIGLFKFDRVRAVSRLLSPKLADAILQLEDSAAGNLLVVAVPLFGASERRRGFNQSALLADQAISRLRRLRPHWQLTAAHDRLTRQRSTESSFLLSRSERRRNMAGAFKVTGDVRGRDVLLIDDILTTGATARECSKVLVSAGASRVFVATLARSQKGSVRQQHQPDVASPDVALWDLPATSSIH